MKTDTLNVIFWQTIDIFSWPYAGTLLYVPSFNFQGPELNLITGTFITDYFFHQPSWSLTTWTRYPYNVNGFIHFMESMHIYVTIRNDTEAGWKFTTHQACYISFSLGQAQGNSLRQLSFNIVNIYMYMNYIRM